jgi:Nucleoside-diphosphate-sugar epimerases
MAVVAVAGGTGGVGKTIVERLVQEGKFDVIVLSRSVSTYFIKQQGKAKLFLDPEAGDYFPNGTICADRLQ